MQNKIDNEQSLILIGMPASGKSTVGKSLAKLIEYLHLDTDYLMEAYYSCPLQTVCDHTTKEDFLDIEEQTICALNVQRVVISTGGSVIYRPKAIQHLQSLGKIIYLESPLANILERIAKNPDRGLAIAPNQTIEDLYNERIQLYSQYADYTIHTKQKTVSECCQEITSVTLDPIKNQKPIRPQINSLT